MWFRVDTALPRHRKTKRLARRLGVPVYVAVGLVTCLWGWAKEFCPDGDLGGLDPEDIADVLGWDGDPVELVAALCHTGSNDSGFIGDDMRVHGWGEYQRLQERHAEAGRYGAHVRYHVNAGVTDPDCEYCIKPRETAGNNDAASVCQIGTHSTPKGGAKR